MSTPDPGRVVVHIGLGKTGTSTLQVALNQQREALADLGVLVPGTAHKDTRRAVYDLMGRRIGGINRDEAALIEGAWDRLAGEIAASTAPTVVLSEEMLALARPPVVRRLVTSVAPRRVEVVVTLRDLGRVLGSYWQQMVVMGRTEPLADFLRAVRDPSAGPASAGVAFWLRQDVLRSLDAWETAVPRVDVTVVTVPGRGQPSDLLNDRFAETIGAPAGLLRGTRATGNASLGRVETEVLRRLNVRLGDALAENQRLNLMRILRDGLEQRDGDPITLAPREQGWVQARSATMIAALRERGYRVVGSLDDLVPTPPAAPPARITEGKVADAALDALAALSRDHARLWRMRRRLLLRRDRRRARREGREAPAPARSGVRASRRRAMAFRLRTAALERADTNRALGWAARFYLRRTSGR